MNVIVYKTKHGATRKIAKVLSQYLSDCILMNINDISTKNTLTIHINIIDIVSY